MPIIKFPSIKKSKELVTQTNKVVKDDVDNFKLLPVEMIIHILSYLPVSELPKLLLVNIAFHDIVKYEMLGKTFFQARAFLSSHQRELKTKTSIINRYLDANKMSFFKGNRGMTTVEKSDFNTASIMGFLFVCSGFLLYLADQKNHSENQIEQSLYNKYGAMLALIFAMGVFYAQLSLNKFSHAKLMGTTLQSQDLDSVSLNTDINLALLMNTNIVLGVTTLSQYERVVKTALQRATHLMLNLEMAFKINPCTGHHDLTLDDLPSVIDTDQHMRNYMYNAFTLWKKQRDMNKEPVAPFEQGIHLPSQQIN